MVHVIAGVPYVISRQIDIVDQRTGDYGSKGPGFDPKAKEVKGNEVWSAKMQGRSKYLFTIT